MRDTIFTAVCALAAVYHATRGSMVLAVAMVVVVAAHRLALHYVGRASSQSSV